MQAFRAFRIHQSGDHFQAGLTSLTLDELTPGDVVVEVAWSSINYKDALAATGRGRILRAPVLNGGIDMAGLVLSSDDPRFAPGDAVFCCGAGLSEFNDGGYAQIARVPGDFLRRPPAGLSLRDTMALGTAGLTAALAVQRLQDNGQPSDRGPLLVTGATGGVGSVAISLLSRCGFEVAASTGKPTAERYLRALGASQIVERLTLSTPARPLESALWAGAVDSVGGATLAQLTRIVKPWGNIASIGLTGGIELETTVMPFILRGVSILGVNCIEPPEAVLAHGWARLGTDLKLDNLDQIAPHEVSLDELPDAFEAYMASEVTGRTLVAVNP